MAEYWMLLTKAEVVSSTMAAVSIWRGEGPNIVASIRGMR